MTGWQQLEPSLAAKRRAVFVLAIFFVAWPLCHRLLVLTHDIHPWRFMGFSMYVSPLPKITVRAMETGSSTGSLQLIDMATMSPAKQAALNELASEISANRLAFGKFYDPGDDGAALLDLLQVERVRFQINYFRLARDARIERQSLVFESARTNESGAVQSVIYER